VNLPVTTSDGGSDERVELLYRFVPPADFRAPELPARSAAANAWASLRRLLRPGDRAAEAPARKERELRRLSQLRLDHLVLPIEWADATESLDRAVDALLAPRGESGVVFLVGQPHCGHEMLVEAWAKRHKARLLAPPTPEEILAGAADAPDESHTDRTKARPWAIPALERWFLRHANGLAHVRKLLHAIAGAQAGRGLVGCDSWAWAYLQQVWPLAQPDMLTLQAFDAAALGRLFARLAAPRGQRHLRFRNARTGGEALAVPAAEGAASDELIQLAAHCRGNPAVARSYWRERLRSEPDDQADEQAEQRAADDEESSVRLHERIVWLADALGEPTLPLEDEEDVALLLHALLLHGGLPGPLLQQVVPVPASRCDMLLVTLQHLGLLQQHDDRWTVAPLGYPLVRRWLRGRGYLVDAF
jgi:hypothetical protein